MKAARPSMRGALAAKAAKPLDQLSEKEMERKIAISRVTTQVLTRLTRAFVERRFEWLLPVIFSRSTDPLWPDPGASLEKRIAVEIYDTTMMATSSMIVQKMVACSLAYPRLYALSPNIRVERRERATTGRHLYEFTQLDFEAREATSKDVMTLVEDVLRELIQGVKEGCKQELTRLNRYDGLSVPTGAFKVYDRKKLEETLGAGWERRLPVGIEEPVWVTNIPREFYDFEDAGRGAWDNYDLVLPVMGEVLSGARREWEYAKLVAKMERDGVSKENYRVLLGLAKEGRLKPSAGAGIGLERLIGWIVGAKHVAEVQPFPKVPGEVSDL
jgi:asparaginyl-tRNA synthetase